MPNAIWDFASLVLKRSDSVHSIRFRVNERDCALVSRSSTVVSGTL